MKINKGKLFSLERIENQTLNYKKQQLKNIKYRIKGLSNSYGTGGK